MRTFALIVLAASAPALAPAEEPPLVALEVRVAGGVAMDSGARTAWRVAPLGIGVGAEGALRADPWVSLYGLAFAEGDDLHFGAAAGARFRPSENGALRFGLGVSSVLAPATLFGLQAATGGCFKPEQVRVCAELEATAYLAGDLLPADQIGARVRLALELGFDVL